MRRRAMLCIILILIIVSAALSRTAIDPQCFSGQWYSLEDQSLYMFREGLIYSSGAVAFLDENPICGAYSYCNNKIYLFAHGISGLETEKELYFIHNRDSSFLCDTEDGFGKIYFVRYSQ